MASVVSAGASPLSGYEMLAAESTGDTEESWQYLEDMAGGNNGGAGGAGPASLSFYPSPASAGSLGSSYAVIAHQQRQVTASPVALSPLFLDLDGQQTVASPFAAGPLALPDGAAGGAVVADPFTAVSSAEAEQFMASLQAQDTSFMTAQNLALFTDEQLNQAAAAAAATSPYFNTFMPTTIVGGIHTSAGAMPGLESLDTTATALAMQQVAVQHSPAGLGIPSPYQSSADVPWDPTATLKRDNAVAGPGTGGNNANTFVMEEFISASPSYSSRSASVANSVSPSPVAAAAASRSPRSPNIKRESVSGSAASSDKAEFVVDTSALRKIKGAGAKVEKKKSGPSSSTSSGSSSAVSEPTNKFVIMTPTIINAHAGRPNPFECFDAMRTTSRGRKGPLANETKENALQVRRLGACFCCHSRKVKCDKERPCKNCKKLMVAVPQIVCWQFQDFLTVLFPDFIRGHFRRDEMTRFISENVEGFGGPDERSYAVELYSGPRFSAIMTVHGRFFTAKTPEVLQHWHLQVGANQMELQSRGAAPIGVDLDSPAARDELRRKAREYIANIVTEPFYAEQVTDAFRHTDLPRKVVKIVQNFAMCSDSPIVKRALSIYAMHYVMTRHLCLTRQSIAELGSTGQVPQNVAHVTPRVLNRQIKSIIDEMLMREMQQLFESFSKSLKPKSRREWAPCLAGFLVLCLFMEALETAADNFVVSQNEVNLRNRYSPEYEREFALKLNREVENMPFKQFAYQFHQIYQTHSRDANSKAFNPLLDEEPGDLDGPAVIMVGSLKELLQGDSWAELDFLTMDPIMPSGEGEDHPYPRDISINYTGRLVAKFLLSFTDEKYIFDAQS